MLIAIVIFLAGMYLLFNYGIIPYSRLEEKNLVEEVSEAPHWTAGHIEKIRYFKGDLRKAIIRYKDTQGRTHSIEETLVPRNLNGVDNYVVVYNERKPDQAYVKWEYPLLPLDAGYSLIKCKLDKESTRKFGVYLIYAQLKSQCPIGEQENLLEFTGDSSYLNKDSARIEFRMEGDKLTARIYNEKAPLYLDGSNGGSLVQKFFYTEN